MSAAGCHRARRAPLAGLLLMVTALATAADTPRPAAGDPVLTAMEARRGDPEAQHRLALMYLRGEGVEADQAWAVTWLRRAAASGHRAAAERLARIYREAGLEPPPGLVNEAGRAPARAPAPGSPQAELEAGLPDEERKAIAAARRQGISVYFGEQGANAGERAAGAPARRARVEEVDPETGRRLPPVID